ncbi:hypothetical protein AMTR_s00046p00061710 [Amborella trichopoda]|uniref:Uncharacterized protein n=1 Tax=Amborella trichopoda TaxID=13333 RepID=U5CX79_AMBTC|nr:hypothetical protein AMTR_s00046p00061710 [Amborella trichopoda]
MRQCVAIPWDYGTQTQFEPMVRPPSYLSEDQLSHRLDTRGHQVLAHREQLRGQTGHNPPAGWSNTTATTPDARFCAFSGGQADDLCIDNSLDSPRPSRKHFHRNSATKSSNAYESCRADRPSLRTSPPNPRVAPGPSMTQNGLGASHTIDSTAIAQAVLQVIISLSLGHAVNLSAWPN